MKHLVTILLFIIITFNSLAQKIEPYFSFGYGSYKQTDIKAIFNIYVNSMSFTVPITDFFPCYYNYDGGINYKFSDDKLEAGLSIAYTSSGARATRSDYSGSYNIDFTTRATGIAGSFGMRLMQCKWFDIYSKVRLGLLSTKLEINESLNVEIQPYAYSNTSESKSFSIEPMIELSKSFRHFGVFVNTGYLVDVTAKLYLPDHNITAFKINGKDAVSNWSGYRIRGGIKAIIQNLF